LLQLGNRHAVPPLGVEQYFQSYGGSSDKGKILGDGKQFIGDLLDSLAILRPRAVLAQQSKLELQDEKVESLGGFLLLHGLHVEAGDVVAELLAVVLRHRLPRLGLLIILENRTVQRSDLNVRRGNLAD